MGITRVVAAIDFSTEADLALAHAVSIAGRPGAHLTIVYAEPDASADPPAVSSHLAGAAELAEVAAEAAAEARVELERRISISAAEGIDTDGVLRAGAPDEVIADVASDLGAELT